MCFASLACSSWCLQCVSTHQPHWVYRDSEENFQSRCFSGKFGGSEERPCLSLPGVLTLELFWNNAEEPSADTSHTVSPIQPVKHTPESPSPMETQSFCRPLRKKPDVCGLMWSLRKNTFSERSDLTSLSDGPGAERLEGIRISSGQAENVLNGSEKSADAARMNFKCVMGGLITKTEQSEWVSRARFDQIIEAGSFRGCRRSGPERNVLFIYFISSRWRFSQSKQCYIQIVFCLVN